MCSGESESEPDAVFLVQVRELLDPTWIEYLGDVQFVTKHDESRGHSTVMAGVVANFAAFSGLIGRLQNLGLTVLSISFYQSAAK